MIQVLDFGDCWFYVFPCSAVFQIALAPLNGKRLCRSKLIRVETGAGGGGLMVKAFNAVFRAIT
jgi:hypothetical protein